MWAPEISRVSGATDLIPGPIPIGRKNEKMMENSILDEGWIDLMREAQSLGLTVQEVHQFFQHSKKEAHSKLEKKEKPIKAGFSSIFEISKTP